jgi:phosphate transport system permease protein
MDQLLIPKVVVDSTGKQHAADANIYSLIRTEVERASDIRERVLDINQNKIGRVNAEMEETRIALRRAEDRQEPMVALTDKIASLDRQFAELKNEAEAISKPTAMAHLEGVDAKGHTVSIPFSNIVRAWEPNRMTLGDRISLMFSRFREFLFDAPREANTEGGLMPGYFWHIGDDGVYEFIGYTRRRYCCYLSQGIC